MPLGGYVAFPANIELSEEGEIVKGVGTVCVIAAPVISSVYVRTNYLYDVSELDDPDLLQNRPPLQRAFVISAGVLANVLLTFLIATGTSLTTGIGTPVYSDGITVTMIQSDNSPAYKAGIKVDYKLLVNVLLRF